MNALKQFRLAPRSMWTALLSMVARLCMVALLCTAALMPACQRKSPPQERKSPSQQATGSSATSVVTLPKELAALDGPGLLQFIKKTPHKGVLVNVWATWCGSCKAEMPMLLELRQEYEKRGIELFFVSVDDPKDVSKVVSFLKEQEAPLPSLIVGGPLGPFKQAMSSQWKGSLPATFLFDRTGQLRYFWGAQVFENELRPILDGFLDGKAIDGAANFSIRRGGGPPQD